MRSLIPFLLGTVFVGCKAKDPDPTLEAFSSCGEMERYIRKMARKEAQYAWAWDGFGTSDELKAARGDAADTEFATADDEESGSASSYSTTNLQESGVDEDDLVKTDGTYLYALSGRYLTISQAWPTEEGRLLSTVEIDGSPQGIYLVDGYVVVVSEIEGWGERGSPRSGAELSRRADAFTLATIIDVTDPVAPEVVRETYASGAFEASRRIDERLYLVTYEPMHITDGADSLSEARRRIRNADAEKFLPWRLDNVLRSADWEVRKGSTCDCTDVYASEDETGTWITSVMSLDLSDPLGEFEGEAVVGRADTVYASTQSIFVGYSEWTDEEGAFVSTDGQLDSIVHRFDISDAAAHPAYRATAKVPGEMYSQFALSEYEGVLRIATTEVTGEWNASGSVRTVSMGDGQSTVLDAITGLAEGESIFAVRFVGDIGYVVTYEQQWGDPLFTIDLSDPNDIQVAGELAVTGFSNYLHPMDDDHLLAVGMDEDSEGSWYLAISLFDVSDLSSPVLADRLLLDAWSSEAQDEHHAFNYFADEELLAIPSTTTEGESVLEVIHATPDGLSAIGRISQEAVLDLTGADGWCAPVRRSVAMESDLWAYSEAGLTAAAIDDPETVKATVAFAGTDPCADSDYEEDW